MNDTSAIASKTLLRFFHFKDLPNWSTYSIFSKSIGFGKTYEFVPISEILKRVRREIIIDDETEYKRVTIKLFGKGLKIRDTAFGKDIGTKRQFVAKTGDFLLSKIDARNGAFGLADETINDAIITNDFPSYEVNEEKVLSNYFELITHTQAFLEFCRSASSGTTGRQRVDEQALLNCRVPLPSKDVQRKLVDAYQSAIAEAAAAIRQAAEIEQSIENYLLDELGIEIVKNEIKKGLQFIAFKELNEWGIDKIFGLNKARFNKYSVISLNNEKNLYTGLFRGKSPKYKSGTKASIINQKCIRWNDVDLNHAKTVDEKWLRSINGKFLTRYEDILINSTGEGTIGRSAFIDKSQSFLTNLLYDSHVLLLRLNKNRLNSAYFTNLFNSSFVQNQINEIKSAQSTKQTELGIENLLKIKFPLPPLPIQERIVSQINARREQIKTLRETAKTKREQAKADFENALFET